jgi:hypothetical protein
VLTRILLSIAFLFSALFLPWWLTVSLGILAVGFFRMYIVVVFGGFLMDMLFGVAEPRLFGFSFIYTGIFLILALIAWFLDRAILE